MLFTIWFKCATWAREVLQMQQNKEMKSENNKFRNSDIRVPFNVHAKIYSHTFHPVRWC